MSKQSTVGGFSRRSFLAMSGAGAAVCALGERRTSASEPASIRLTASSATAALLGEKYPTTPVWTYNGKVPGPLLRLERGNAVRISVTNNLREETTVHWHGLRVPNAMDGVPHLTQRPIAPDETFTYEFTPPDAGTYWYHPHQNSHVQVGRGLYGPLIVPEINPPRVDRDLVWMLDDWRLQRNAQIREDFGNRHDLSHGGRVGNTVTINGQVPGSVVVRQGERLRLRLINAANARTFALDFGDLRPQVVALDGQAVTPHAPLGGQVVLGSAMRVDLILDVTGKSGDRVQVMDRAYDGLNFRLVEFVYKGPPLREKPLDADPKIEANGLPEPDLKNAQRHQIDFGGGMMGGMRGATMDGRRVGMMEMMRRGMAWSVNGVVVAGHNMDPVLTLNRGRSYVLQLNNDTAWHHPIHLHGHSFRVITRNGKATQYREWQDTVLMVPRERTEIAFVADNPGDWMLHCHILEHQAAGMMSVVRVL